MCTCPGPGLDITSCWSQLAPEAATYPLAQESHHPAVVDVHASVVHVDDREIARVREPAAQPKNCREPRGSSRPLRPIGLGPQYLGLDRLSRMAGSDRHSVSSRLLSAALRPCSRRMASSISPASSARFAFSAETTCGSAIGSVAVMRNRGVGGRNRAGLSLVRLLHNGGNFEVCAS
jgi:hypothetical protein